MEAEEFATSMEIRVVELLALLEQLEVAEESASSAISTDPSRIGLGEFSVWDKKKYDICVDKIIVLRARISHPIVLAKVLGRYDCNERKVIWACTVYM